jgi:hypothetical protein
MFCEKCGGRVNDDARFCSSCGAEIANGATAFLESGEYQGSATGAVVTKGKKKAKKITLIIKNSLILLLAVIMFAFSFFPIIGVGTEYLGVDVKVNFSAIDSISILFSSFSNYSDIAEIPAYDDMMELSETLQEELGDLSDMSEKEAVKMFASEISRISILTIKASLMYEGAKAPIAYWFAAILSFIYMALTAAFFVLAILNFIATFGVIKTGKRFDLWCAALLSAATVSLLLLFYVMGVSYSAAASIISMTGFSVATVIIAAVTVVYSIVQRMIFARNKNIKVLVMRSVVAVLALVVMIAVISPIAYSTVSKKNVAIRVGSFNAYSTLSEEDLEGVNGIYNQMEREEVESIYKSLAAMTSKQLSSTEGETVNNSLISLVVRYWYFPGTVFLFSLIPVVCIIALIAAALVMWHCIKSLILGSECKRSYLAFRISLTLVAVMVLAFAITFTVMMDYAAGEMAGRGYSVVIGASSILVTIFAVAIMAMPTFKYRYDADENEIDEIEENEEASDSATEGEMENSVLNVAEEIKALKELYDIGAINDEEFSAKKAQLLGI